MLLFKTIVMYVYNIIAQQLISSSLLHLCRLGSLLFLICLLLLLSHNLSMSKSQSTISSKGIHTPPFPSGFDFCFCSLQLAFSVPWHGLCPFDRHLESVSLYYIWYYVSWCTTMRLYWIEQSLNDGKIMGRKVGWYL